MSGLHCLIHYLWHGLQCLFPQELERIKKGGTCQGTHALDTTHHAHKNTKVTQALGVSHKHQGNKSLGARIMLAKAGMHEPLKQHSPNPITAHNPTRNHPHAHTVLRQGIHLFTYQLHHPTKASPGMKDRPIQQALILLPFSVKRSGSS